MNPSIVFFPRRLERATRNALIARTCCSLLAAATAILPGVQSASAQAPGTRDAGFTPGLPAATVYATLFQTDGTNNVVLAGGDIGYLQTNLQANGVPAATFVAPVYGSGFRIVFTAVPEQVGASATTIPKVLLGGLFGQSATQVASRTPAQNITRILPDGTQDAAFVAGVKGGANNYVTSILALASGKIVVGGLFTAFNAQSRLRIVRLNNDGTIDAGFGNSSAIDGDVLALAEGITPFVTNADHVTPQTDGNTLVGGTFNHVGGRAITKLARLDVNGKLDPNFKPVINSRVLAITVQPSGKIIIGGEFTQVNGKPVAHIARLNYDGSLDTTFATTVSGLPAGQSNPIAVYVLKQLKPTPLPDGTLSASGIYVAGNFTQIDGATRRYLGFINPTGTVGTFNPGTTIYDKVQTVSVEPNGRVLVGETLGARIGKNFQPSLIQLFGATTTN